jgi:ketosteroid isomerase-like protein
MTDASGGEDSGTPGDDSGGNDEGDVAPREDASGGSEDVADAESQAELREQVGDAYDFEEFGPREMAEMDADEWDAAFDPDTWITGGRLLDRVEADLRHRVATRDVFAVVERDSIDGEPVVLAYSDEGYAVVYADGTVQGSGTVLRDVKPSVALCSMDDYDVPEAPEHAGLPDPQDVPEGSGGLGTRLLQYVGLAQLVAGVLLFLAPFVYDPLVRTCPPIEGATGRACTVAGATLELHPLGNSAVIAVIAGVGFVLFGALMLVIVANARLSDRFRSEEFRQRLRAAGVGEGERPEFVPETDSER